MTQEGTGKERPAVQVGAAEPEVGTEKKGEFRGIKDKQEYTWFREQSQYQA